MSLHSPVPTHPTRPDVDALERLLPRIRRRARALTRCLTIAEDLAQDCAAKLWTCLQRGDQIDDLEAYAMITLRHLSISTWRTQPAFEQLEENSATTLPDALPKLILCDVLAAIDALPDAQADILRLIVDGETSPAALAAQLGLRKGTVMSRLARARATLRRNLDA